MHVKIFKKVAFFLGVVMISVMAANAQSVGTFSDINVDYTFELPDAKWKMTNKPSTTSPNVEYVYVDRLDGHLEVRKQNVPRTTLMSDILREEEQKLQFRPGYVAGKEENFAGKLNGSIFNFEYVRAGRPMSGRTYVLRSGDSVYYLRFTGYTDKLRSIRHQTDAISRTFDIKR